MSYASEVLADSPRAWFRMQESSGNIQDSSGLAHHATATNGGAATYSQTGPITGEPVDKAILFNSGSFNVPDHADLDLGDVFTLEAWVKRTSTGGAAKAIVSKQNGGYYMRLNDGDLQLVRSNVALIVTATTTISDTTTWHHVVVTKNGATVKLYLDKVDVTGAVTDSTCVDNALNLNVGSDNDTTEYIDHYLDEVAVYATALSQARVQAHFDAIAVPPAASSILMPRAMVVR